MNCISGSTLLICLLAGTACGIPDSESAVGKPSTAYSVHYTISPDPGDGSVDVTMTVEQTRGQFRELAFQLGNTRASDFVGDGELLVGEDQVRWLPGRTGGKLRWRVAVQHQRDGGGFDAWLGADWGIFRAEDIIPRARSRTLRGARSATSMSFELPDDWHAVTEYAARKQRFEIRNPARRFDQPRGWIVIGKLGIRRETIAATRIAVAAPQGQAVRRLDMLALLNWTLPELTAVLPNTPPRLTIVSAGDPMWHGGLSAPASVFIHAERPLISENATSTLLHEVVHVALGISAASNFDWIVEGLAEYYSLELLQRGGAITPRRYQRALEKQSQWAKEAKNLCTAQSTGPITALAVITFRHLDEEIRKKTGGQSSLDTVVAGLAAGDAHITLQSLAAVVAEVLQEPSTTLQAENLPGCAAATEA
jgi:hypothetical protein